MNAGRARQAQKAQEAAECSLALQGRAAGSLHRAAAVLQAVADRHSQHTAKLIAGTAQPDEGLQHDLRWVSKESEEWWAAAMHVLLQPAKVASAAGMPAHHQERAMLPGHVATVFLLLMRHVAACCVRLELQLARPVHDAHAAFHGNIAS